MNPPLVSVVIITWNRLEYLEKCIRSVRSSLYDNYEIIVVDNDSKDGTPDVIPQKQPDLLFIRNQCNMGCGPARNVGLKAAEGKYILQLDDDSFIDRHAIGKIVDIFESNPEIGAIATKIIDVESGKIITDGLIKNAKNFWGGGAALRCEMLEKTGFYPEEMFFGAEELDLSIRIRDVGRKIKYAPEVVVYHYYVDSLEKKRISRRRFSSSLCSWIWLFPKYFPWPLVFVFWFRLLVRQFLLAWRHRRIITYFGTVFYAFWKLPSVLGHRKVVNAATVRYYYNPDLLPDCYNVPLYRKILDILGNHLKKIG